MNFVRIDASNSHLLNEFLNNAGNALETFRYFRKRSLHVLKHHIYTVICEDHEEQVGYGHLDKEDDTIWLGIAVIEGQQGKGYGRAIMDHLISVARTMRVERIRLSVDKINKGAIRLYEKFGFKQVTEQAEVAFYQLDL